MELDFADDCELEKDNASTNSEGANGEDGDSSVEDENNTGEVGEVVGGEDDDCEGELGVPSGPRVDATTARVLGPDGTYGGRIRLL